MKTYLLILCFLAVYTSLNAQIEVIDFETPSFRIEVDSANPANLWQVGHPDKVVFQSAHSPVNAIVTDTINPYPVNNLSAFTVGFELYAGQPSVSFHYRMETQTGYDGGYVEVSKDSGMTWQLLVDTSGQGFTFFYDTYGLFTQGFYTSSDTLYNGTPGFSGSASGWNWASVNFPCLAIKKPFELQLRFTFISDSMQGVSATDGWIIDDIVIDNTGICSSLPEGNQIPQLSVNPNPIVENGYLDMGSIYLAGAHMDIYNAQGKLLRSSGNLYGNEVRIARGNLSPGFYTAIIKSNDGKTLAVSRLVFR